MNQYNINAINEAFDWMNRFIYDDQFRESANDDSLSYETCKTPQDLLNWMDCIEYGWVDKYGKKREGDDNFGIDYRLQSPNQLLNSHVGVCWDQAELENKWFKEHKYTSTMLYLELNDGEQCPTHTCIIYEEEDGYYWFEHSWYDFKGIHKYDRLSDLIKDLKIKFRESHNDFESPLIITSVLSHPSYNASMSCEQFMNFCRNQLKVDTGDVSNEIFGESYDYFDERSHGTLKRCYRCVYDKDGNAYQIIFDLKQEDIKFAGTHDPNGESDGIGWDYDPKKPRLAVVRSEGEADFVSQSTVKQIIKLDTKEHVNSVTAVGIDYRSTTPVKYVVGQREPTQSFKSTSPQNVGFDKRTGKIEYNMDMERINDDIKAKGYTWIPGYGPIKKVRHMDSTPSNGAPTKIYKKAFELYNKRINEIKSCHHDWNDITNSKKLKIYNFKNPIYQCKNCGIFKLEDGKLYFACTSKRYPASINFDRLMDFCGNTNELKNFIYQPQFESYDSNNDDSNMLNEDVEFDEMSHGKLKYDFRKGYDMKTGHMILLIYSLNDIKVTYPGHGHVDGGFQKGIKDIDPNELQTKNKHVQDTISKKGNMDHQSYGEKLLAIKDEVTGKKLQSVEYVGLYNNYISRIGEKMLGAHEMENIREHDKKSIFKIKVGDIETADSPSFKSTKLFKSDPMRDEDYDVDIDLSQNKMAAVERLKYGRGFKLDDIDASGKHIGAHDNFAHKHQSKREKAAGKITAIGIKNGYLEDLADEMMTFDVDYQRAADLLLIINKWNNGTPKILQNMPAQQIINQYRTVSKLSKITAEDINNYLIPVIEKNKNELDQRIFDDLIDRDNRLIDICNKCANYLSNHGLTESYEGDIMDDDLDWITDYLMEDGDATQQNNVSLPKQRDAEESDKNGVRRKKLYIAFIEWAKAYNNKNSFGSIFDKDIFHVTYPFVPEEMRYFYRLANPMLCVLGGNLTFFPVAELRSLNSKNSHLDQMMIFAATETDLRVFNKSDKKVYRATDENGAVTLQEVLGDTFDLYIQNMIKQGDILNAPLEQKQPEEQKPENNVEDNISDTESK